MDVESLTRGLGRLLLEAVAAGGGDDLVRRTFCARDGHSAGAAALSRGRAEFAAVADAAEIGRAHV